MSWNVLSSLKSPWSNTYKQAKLSTCERRKVDPRYQKEFCAVGVIIGSLKGVWDARREVPKVSRALRGKSVEPTVKLTKTYNGVHIDLTIRIHGSNASVSLLVLR